MSKLVNWGHLIAASLIGAEGLGYLWTHGVTTAVHVPKSREGNFYPVYDAFGIAALSILDAWGLWRWRRWARTLAIVFSVPGCVAVAIVLPEFRWNLKWVQFVVFAGLQVCMLAWLFLPAMKAEYVRRSQMA